MKKIAKISLLVLLGGVLFSNCSGSGKQGNGDSTTVKQNVSNYQPVDTLAYLQKVKALANNDTTGKWPVKKQPYPLPGAILPFKRIVAYYGNLYSVRMGILGELPPKQMLAK